MSLKSSPNRSALAVAASRPGADPRVWLTFARVTELGFDIEHGIFADLVYLPDGDEETALVGTCYAGSGFGAFTPFDIDDVVLVAIGQGDPAIGPVIIARIWNAGDPPPVEMAQNDDVTSDEPTTNPTFRTRDGTVARIVGRNGATVRVEVSGGSTFDVTATDGSTVTIAADGTVEVTGQASVRINSDTNITLDAPVMKLGAAAVLGVARMTDTTTIGTGAGPMLTALATAAGAASAAWAALAVALPPMAATATPAAAALTVFASTVAAAAAPNGWGTISKASTKALSE